MDRERMGRGRFCTHMRRSCAMVHVQMEDYVIAEQVGEVKGTCTMWLFSRALGTIKDDWV